MPVWPTVSMIQLPFAFPLHLCELDLPADHESGFAKKKKEVPHPIHYLDLMLDIVVLNCSNLVCNIWISIWFSLTLWDYMPGHVTEGLCWTIPSDSD